MRANCLYLAGKKGVYWAGKRSQMIHSGSRKKQENLTIPAENVLSRPSPPLYKVLARTDFAKMLAQDEKTILNKVTKFQTPTPNRLGARIEKPPGAESALRKV